jgi:hypothetical protein
MSLIGKIFRGAKHIIKQGKKAIRYVAGKVKQGTKFVENVIEKTKGALAQAKQVPVLGNVLEYIKEAFPEEIKLLEKGADIIEMGAEKIGDVAGKVEDIVG